MDPVLALFLQRLAISICSLLLFGCQTVDHRQSSSSPPIPMNSAVMLPHGGSMLMAQNVYLQLKTRIKKTYGCENFTVEKVAKTGGDSDLAIDTEGRLWRGVIAESWAMTVCGSQKSFEIVVTPDGKGGLWLAIGG